jgi:hypothetical protein
MSISIPFNLKLLSWTLRLARRLSDTFWVVALATMFSIGAIIFNLLNDYIVRYGDSESHLNIAKRVVDSVTPGFAQLGGIWLPVPHLLMVPFVSIDALWRTGLAGAIISGLAFIFSALYLYKTTLLLTKHRAASFVAALVFILNPNVLYLQSTPMTEVLLIAFFTVSTYYFILFLQGKNQLYSLLLAALFGFLSVLTRYDGWFLVVLQAGCIFLYFYPWNRVPKTWTEIRSFFRTETWKTAEGYMVLFSTLAFLGIILWLGWDLLILGDPLYFTHSEFSAKSQQNEWLSRGQLPAYHNLPLALLYYAVTAMGNAGVVVFALGVAGLSAYLRNKGQSHRLIILLVMAAPFIFNVITQYIGQSVIFIPDVTPAGFDWTMFNVRYGVMTVPLVAVLIGYLFYRSRAQGRAVIAGLILVQVALFQVGYSRVIAWQDGMVGLSSAKRPEAERWLKANYDYGYVLMDDYARTISVVRTEIPMENMIYIGNKPYWEESLDAPEKYARWIVMQQNDAVWKRIWEIPGQQGRLYKYFEKVYTSPEIIIFRRQAQPPGPDRFWSFQCIDTMKYSRDAARELVADPNLESMVAQEMQLIKDAGGTCASVGTPYDEEFVPYLSVWVRQAREKGLNVWFRGNMAGWEGWFDYPKLASTRQHHEGIYKFITSHKDLFKPGDIFTPAPEPENGIMGDPRDSDANREMFLKFIPESYSNCREAFAKIDTGVTCGYFSYNGDVARDVVTPDLISQSGNALVVDHFVSDPDNLVKDLRGMHDKFHVPIVLGEFGAPINDVHGEMDEQGQKDYLSKLLARLYKERGIIQGLNYWVLRGGSTAMVNPDLTPRPAYDAVKAFYLPGQVRGTVTNTLGETVADLDLSVAQYEARATTDGLGNYVINVPSGEVKLQVEGGGWVPTADSELTGATGNGEKDIVVEPRRKSLWYRFKQWWFRK